ncbi:MAG: 23S rRNA (pseudouridine(1915)-N(3))-methyltransferase RlmH [Gammaproteobacteria bacterium]
MLKRAARADRVIALDQRGREWSSAALAAEMRGWRDNAADVALLIGGPDGLADVCRERADDVWSLSRLTLPHGLVRVVLAEQIYRAWTILQGHPYHRE